MFHGNQDDEDPPFPSESRSDGDHEGLGGTLLGLGFLVVGGGVYGLLGGDSESLRDYPLWADFDAPLDAGAQPVPAHRETEGDCEQMPHPQSLLR